MGARFIETRERLRIGEDHLGKGHTIQHTAAHELRPYVRNCEQAVGVGRDRFASKRNGIDDVRAEIGEDASNLALPRSDATRQSDPHSMGGDRSSR